METMKSFRTLGCLVLAVVMFGASMAMPLEKLHAAQPVQAPSKVVNINKADANELISVRGIGPKLADRILQYRKANGNFARVEDLSNVSGIGGSKFEKIKDQVTV